MRAGVLLAVMTAAPAALAAPTATSPEYVNFNNALHLNSVNVLPAWSRGATGAGVTIALIDSGVDFGHPELAGRIAGDGGDYVFGDGHSEDDAMGHGTFVAGLMVANYQDAGIVGIAYQAKVTPYKVFHNELGGGFEVFAAIDAAARSNARILNLSFGGRLAVPQELAVLQRGIANGKLIVMSAGNDGAPTPDFPGALAPQLGPGALVVGALGPDGQIAFFSNRAGPARDYYLLAPGWDVWSTVPGGSFAPGLGSSISAAYVSGAAALLMQAFPNLSAAQVGQILLLSADDLGAPGVDDINGHGRLNIGRAFQPIGTARIPAGLTAGSAAAPLEVQALRLSPAFGAALLADRARIANGLFVDSFDRAYPVDLGDLVSFRPRRSNLTDRFAWSFLPPREIVFGTGDRHQLEVGYDWRATTWYTTPPDLADREQWQELGADAIALHLEGPAGAGRYRLNWNQPHERSGMAETWNAEPGRFYARSALTTPYFGFADRERIGYYLSYPISAAWRAQAGYSVQRDARAAEFGASSDAAVMEAIWEPLPEIAMHLRWGEVREDGSLFGGASGGSFSVRDATTRFAGIGATLNINEHWSLVANADFGRTNVSSAAHSLLRDFSALRSDAFSIGVTGSGLWRRDDRFGIAVTRPLRVGAGSAVLSLPTGLDAASRVIRTESRLSLEPDGHEIDLDAYYEVPLARNTYLSTNVFFARAPNHVADAGWDVTISAAIRFGF